MPSRQVGLTLMLLGAAIAVVGLLAWAGWLSWFGRLPGDFRIERPGVRVYLPLASMLLISVVLSLLVNLLRRLF
ncbi:MAG: DUF2905 domain-containing protein [Thermoanaerobaculia bacterium]